jgi:hypothetical protein
MSPIIRRGIAATLVMAALIVPATPAQTDSTSDQIMAAVNRADTFVKQGDPVQRPPPE